VLVSTIGTHDELIRARTNPGGEGGFKLVARRLYADGISPTAGRINYISASRGPLAVLCKKYNAIHTTQGIMQGNEEKKMK